MTRVMTEDLPQVERAIRTNRYHHWEMVERTDLGHLTVLTLKYGPVWGNSPSDLGKFLITAGIYPVDPATGERVPRTGNRANDISIAGEREVGISIATECEPDCTAVTHHNIAVDEPGEEEPQLPTMARVDLIVEYLNHVKFLLTHIHANLDQQGNLTPEEWSVALSAWASVDELLHRLYER